MKGGFLLHSHDKFFCLAIWKSSFLIHKSSIVDSATQLFKNFITVDFLINHHFFAFMCLFNCYLKILTLKKIKTSPEKAEISRKNCIRQFSQLMWTCLEVFSIDLIKERGLAFCKFGNFHQNSSGPLENPMPIFWMWPMFIIWPMTEKTTLCQAKIAHRGYFLLCNWNSSTSFRYPS